MSLDYDLGTMTTPTSTAMGEMLWVKTVNYKSKSKKKRIRCSLCVCQSVCLSVCLSLSLSLSLRVHLPIRDMCANMGWAL